jgi:tight adherence protein B
VTRAGAATAGAWLLTVWAAAACLDAGRALRLPRRSPSSAPGGSGASRRPRVARLELPELVESLAGAAGSGRSLGVCLLDAAAGLPDAERSGLLSLAGSLRHGHGLVAAFDRWADGTSVPGAGLVAAAVGMATTSGGELDRSLAGVASTLRERRALDREVRALGAQARLSAVVLAIAPLGVVLLGAAVDADLAAFLVGEPAGRACLAAGLVLDAVSWRWMRWLAGAVAPGPRRADPASTLPEVVDLLAVAAAVGLPVAGSLAGAGPRCPEPWRAAIARCLEDAEGGALLADALADLARAVGPSSAPLVAALTDALADGDRLVPGLARVATDARDLRRRTAEERAGRLPVRMLAPLVCCSLPAFVLVALVPLLAGALAGLSTP